MIKQTGRKSYLDLLRILAAFLVIYNHTPGFHFFMMGTGQPAQVIGSVALSSFAKINVPLFFMLSGTLLLGREESYGVLFKKRILRFAAVLLLAGSFYYFANNRHDFRLTECLKVVLSGDVNTEYWFLYSYMAFLLMLPFLRKIAAAMTGQDFLLLLILRVALVDMIPMLQYLTAAAGRDFVALSSNFYMAIPGTDFLCLPLMGYYLDRKLPSHKLKKLLPLAVVLILGDTFLSTGITWQLWQQGEAPQDYLGLFRALSAASVFLLAKYAFENCSRLPEKFLATASSVTLGIYLMDPLFIDPVGLFWRICERFGEQIVANVFLIVPMSLLYCAISMVLCGTITWVLKKLPVVRHLL